MTVVAAGSDSSGYLNSARLFAAGRLQSELRVPGVFGRPEEVNVSHFSPQGFNLFGGSVRLSPTYPTGLPLHFAIAGRLAGWHAGPFAVQLLAALGAVWLCYLAARALGIGPALAVAGAAMLAAFPVFIFTSIQTLSDTLATTWALAALLAGIRSRESPRWTVGCGAALAVAVLVRPTNLLLAPALVVLVGGNWRRLALFGAGGLPGAVWLAFYNHHLYGGVMRSGYGNIFAAFDWGFGVPTAAHFARWLAWLLPAVALVLPFAAPVWRDPRRREWIALALAFSAVAGLYLFYDVSHDDWWCLRFILPAVGALILLALLGADALVRRFAVRRPSAWAAALALILAGWAGANSWYWTRHLHVLYVPGYERAYGEAAALVAQHVPARAVVVCSVFSGTLYYYTDLPALVYDTMKPEEFERYVTLARKAGREIHAVLFNIEEEDVFRNRCPGPWRRIASTGNIGLWRLE
jgi:hypothetical protein